MKLKVNNIGKIDNANIEINGITVIAGENNTGKSTIGKVLFSIFNSFYRIDEQIKEEKRSKLSDIYENSFYKNVQYDIETLELLNQGDKFVDFIMTNTDKYIHDEVNFKKTIKDFFVLYNGKGSENTLDGIIDEFIDKYTNKIIELLQISDEAIVKTLLNNKLNSEFNEQINNIYENEESGNIELGIKDKTIKIVVEDNIVVSIKNKISLNTEVIYIDDPFVLDDMTKYHIDGLEIETHRNHLENKLKYIKSSNDVAGAIDEILTTKKLQTILNKLNLVCSGEMIQSKRFSYVSYGYKNDKSDKSLNISNISTGLKTFIILKTLLLNGSLKENGTIVLDEPEIHLHPEWQLVFAELIVLIQKEYNMHILLNTHSPYFLNAIEVYAEKYKILDKCKFYMAENTGSKSTIIDVTDDVDKIYEKLARPLQELENTRYEND